MPSYFKPLRRKIGVLTLVAACGLVFWWIRTVIIVDVIQLGADWSYFGFDTYPGGVNLYRCSHLLRPDGWTNDKPRAETSSNPLYAYDNGKRTIRWRRRWGTIDFGKMDYNGATVEWCGIRFGEIVVLLTLLSAWLLLSKPRAKKLCSELPPKTDS